MAIARTGTSKLAAAAGTSASVTRPTGAATGDLLILAIAAQTATAFTAPAGWTALVNVQDGAASRRFGVFWRIDDGSAGPYSFTYGGANVFRWWRCVSYSGFDPTDPIADFASQINASSVNVVAPTVTVERDGSALVDFSNADGATSSWTPPSGMTAVDDTSNAVWTAEQFSLVSGSTGSKTGVLNTAVPNQGSLVVIQPPPALADYAKTTWADGVDATPTRLNNIESGIEAVTERVQALPSPELVDAIQEALTAARNIAYATPVLVGDFGGTLLAAVTAGSRLCNKDSAPKAAGTGANQNLDVFRPDELGAVPAGFKRQYRLVVHYSRNATATGGNWSWAPWAITASAGGVGVFTETTAAGFAATPQAAVTAPGTQGVADSGWVDDGLTQSTVYGFGVNNSANVAANSAFRWRGKLYSRIVPT